MRVLFLISLIFTLAVADVMAQIACPAMAVTQPNRTRSKQLSGFGSAARGRSKPKPMGDFFSSRKRGGGKGLFEKDEFASRSRKQGRFRMFDEFSTRTKRRNAFRDMDEFAYRRKTKRINIDSQFNSRSTAKRFKRKSRMRDEFSSKRKRSKRAKQEYTPFATSASPYGAVKKREPQMGLWGGSVGKWSGKDKRPDAPLPKPEKEKED